MTSLDRRAGSGSAFAAALALLLTAVLPVRGAQDAPTPPEALAGLSLTYKFKPGQVQRFRANATMDFTVTPEGGGAGLGPMPITAKMQMLYAEKVAGERDGTGTLAWTLANMTQSYNVLGNTMVMKFANGKLANTMNGQPAPAMGVDTAQMQAQLAKPVMFRRTPRGEMTAVDGGTAPVGAGGLGGPSLSIAFLPDRPVQVGDTWETVQKVQASVPNPSAQVQIPEIEARFTHTLQRLESKDGKAFAIIESSGSGAAPEGVAGAVSGTQNVSGTTRFDVTRGAVVSGQYTIDLGMSIPIGAGAAGAAQPPSGGVPQGMRIDGTIQMVVREEVPAPVPTKKPAAKKPAAKRPVRR
jgi:hypothetical protein